MKEGARWARGAASARPWARAFCCRNQRARPWTRARGRRLRARAAVSARAHPAVAPAPARPWTRAGDHGRVAGWASARAQAPCKCNRQRRQSVPAEGISSESHCLAWYPYSICLRCYWSSLTCGSIREDAWPKSKRRSEAGASRKPFMAHRAATLAFPAGYPSCVPLYGCFPSYSVSSELFDWRAGHPFRRAICTS
jgi:hypothetical protein